MTTSAPAPLVPPQPRPPERQPIPRADEAKVRATLDRFTYAPGYETSPLIPVFVIQRPNRDAVARVSLHYGRRCSATDVHVVARGQHLRLQIGNGAELEAEAAIRHMVTINERTAVRLETRIVQLRRHASTESQQFLHQLMQKWHPTA